MTSPLAVRLHPHCVICGAANPLGLGVDFRPSADGRGIEATLDCRADFQGYEGRLHGGIVSSLLDGAMVHCLFERGHTAYTAELRVRFRGAVVTGRPATLRAWLSDSHGRLHRLEAELAQDGEVKAEAQAKFLDISRGSAPNPGSAARGDPAPRTAPSRAAPCVALAKRGSAPNPGLRSSLWSAARRSPA